MRFWVVGWFELLNSLFSLIRLCLRVTVLYGLLWFMLVYRVRLAVIRVIYPFIITLVIVG